MTADSANSKRSLLRAPFVGPKGIRAGWRLLMFLAFCIGIIGAFLFAIHHIPALHAWRSALPENEMSAAWVMFADGFEFAAVFVAALLMSRIEKRTFADYYLPLNQAFGMRFWQGVAYGLAMVSLFMAAIAAFRGFSIGEFALTRGVALKFGALYAIGFTLAGLFEEVSFRGYMQATLGSGIGFWPAAILLSILFGAVHTHNLGETWYGALGTGFFGLLQAFALSRMGNIWFPIGLHAAYGWAETYLFSVPNSGFVAQGQLLKTSLHGPNWITGGTVGPEGSVFSLLVLALGAVGIHFLFPAKAVQA